MIVKLDDGPVTAELLDPVRSFFRHPVEAGFWERIVSDPLDITARLVYADWLDDCDDPHAWVFREPMPFAHGYLRMDWIGAAGRVELGPSRRVPTLWAFAGVTRRDRGVRFRLSDRNPVPPFVAYLLGVTRLRADERLPDADRVRLIDSAHSFGMGLACDILLGANSEPICRVTNPIQTAPLLEAAVRTHNPTRRSGPSAPPDDLLARLRAVNDGLEFGPTTRVEHPFMPLGVGPPLTVADLDPLTGVWHRRAFDVLLNEGVRRAATAHDPLSLLSLDLDHFCQLNRDFSHTEGDRALIEVSGLVREALGERGFLARTSGDGFEAVLPATDLATALETGERLRRVVAEWRGADSRVTLTVSIGVATLDPAAPDAGRLRTDADAARRRAKAGGRNRVSL